jgi:predicted dehydrogenase
MLDKESLDIVIINSENAAHPEVVAACGAAGVHVCIEKPIASSLRDAWRIVRSVEFYGISAVCHWMMPYSPAIMRAKELIDKGAIGRVLEVKMRAAHMGPLAPGVRHPGPNIECEQMTGAELASTWWYQISAGGGAMIDFCSYGTMISRWFIGEQAVAAMGIRANLNSHWSDADDYGTVLARFPTATGVFEGSWATAAPGVPGGPLVYGTDGTLVVDDTSGEQKLSIARTGGKVEYYDGVELQEGHRNVAEEFIFHIETGEPVHPTLDLRSNAEAMAILEAAIKSSSTGKMEMVGGEVWSLRSHECDPCCGGRARPEEMAELLGVE